MLQPSNDTVEWTSQIHDQIHIFSLLLVGKPGAVLLIKNVWWFHLLIVSFDLRHWFNRRGELRHFEYYFLFWHSYWWINLACARFTLFKRRFYHLVHFNDQVLVKIFQFVVNLLFYLHFSLLQLHKVILIMFVHLTEIDTFVNMLLFVFRN